MEDILKLAENAGFSHTGPLNISALNFRREVRDMCMSGRCGHYGKCWTCPPYCGTLEESSKRASKYKNGVLLQTTGEMEDDFDIECIEGTQKKHRENFSRFVDKLKESGADILPMSAGGCGICARCTCPDEPCRFPDRAMISMEAYGLIVSDTCRDSGMKYFYGPGTLTFTSCILY